MHKILTIIFLLSFSISFYSQNIEGVVVNTKTKENVPGINVYIDGTEIGAATDAKGHFEIKEVPIGNHSLIISGMGFRKKTVELNIEENKVYTLTIQIQAKVNSLDEVVINASSLTGGLEGLKEIPGSAHYISPKEIEKFSYTDINRTLRSVPGINLQEEDGFGLRPNIGIRGTGSERSSKITIMEDGVLISPAPYSAPAAYYFPTVGTMQGVEILKGSAQIKYGPYTTGGAINLISTQIPNDFSGKVDILGSSFNGKNVHACVGDRNERMGYLVESFHYSSDGFKTLENGGSTGFNKKDYRVKLGYNTLASAKVYQSLELKMGYSDELSNETYLGLTEDDFSDDPFMRYAGSQEDQMKTDHQQYSLSHLIQPAKNLSIRSTLYRTDFHRNWYKLDAVVDSLDNKVKIGSLLEDPNEHELAFDIVRGDADGSFGTLMHKANNRSYFAQGVQSEIMYEFGNKIDHKIEFGIRIHEDEVDRFQWVDEYVMDDGTMELISSGVPGTESNRIESATAFASHLQYKLEVGKWRIIPGLRYENVNLERIDFGKSDPDRIGKEVSERANEAKAFIPGIGATYLLNEHAQIFGGAHRGYAPPGNKEGAEPESSVNYELGFRENKDNLNLQIVGFINDYENLLGSDLNASGGSGTNELYNGGEVLSYGLEFQIGSDLLAKQNSRTNLPVSIVYTYTNAEFQSSFDSSFDGWGEVESGDQLPYLAQHQFTFMLGLERDDISLNFSGRYTDEMRTSPGQGDLSENEKTDAAVILDASAAYSVSQNVSLFLSGTNISDQIFIVARRPAGLRPGMPRAFNFGVKARF